MDGIVKAEELTVGTVILLPFGKTATVSEPPKVGRTFVTIRTQHGKSRLRKGEEVLVEEKKKP